MLRNLGSALLLSALLAGGCSSIGKISNPAISQLPEGEQRYSSYHYLKNRGVGDTLVILAFSGGGTRAAALSYGVLEELRDTRYKKDGKERRLLDEVDIISSVSGGSFTSAYYGLFGDHIFNDFKEVFLYKDVQGELSSLILGFFDLFARIFTPVSRTEVAIDYYDKNIFRGKTFADMQAAKGPFILINASDLNSQSQFVFIQPQLDFLCSNLSEFKVARAVAASSAVPVLFPPILIERHDDCHYQAPEWLKRAEHNAIRDNDQRTQEAVAALKFYLDKENPPYVTLLDGGITDNLGLRTVLRSVSLSGGVQNMYRRAKRQRPVSRLVVVVVNASTTTDTHIGKGNVLPSIGDILTAVTDIQLHLYNTETNELLKQELISWADTLSTPEYPVTSYFIDLDVTDIKDKEERMFFNNIPTSFSLEKSQADALIKTARRLMRQNPQYRKLLKDMGGALPEKL